MNVKFILVLFSWLGLAIIPVLSGAAELFVTDGEIESKVIEIDVGIDGQTRRFHLDTGANTSMLKPDTQSLSFLVEGTETSRGASGVSFTCDRVRAGRVEAAGTKLSDTVFSRCDHGEHSRDNFGLNLIDGKIVELLFENKEFHIKREVAAQWKPRPLIRLKKGHLKLPVTLGPLELAAVFDTGAEITAVSEAFAASNPQHFKFKTEITNGRNISGQPVAMKIYEMMGLEIDGTQFDRILVAAIEFGDLANYLGSDTPIILGANAISQADWLLDLSQDQWAVRKSSTHCQ